MCRTTNVVLLTLTLLALGSNAQVELVAPCPDDGLSLVPHETDCSKYYICNDGVPLLQACLDGEHFSARLLKCTTPFEAQCENPLCESNGLDIVPDPTDCTRYYICDNGLPIQVTCPAGEHFSEELKKCTDPETAKCTIAICTGTELGTVPHPTNCSEFYYCIDGQPHIMQCPSGLHFSEELKTCVDENTAKCIGKFVCQPDKLETVPYPNDCTKYYICNNGDAMSVKCVDGLHFNVVEGKCTDINSANCIGQYICEGNEIHLVKDDTDCSKYYVCNDGVAINTDCPEGLHFSDELKICTEPSTANCTISYKNLMYNILKL